MYLRRPQVHVMYHKGRRMPHGDNEIHEFERCHSQADLFDEGAAGRLWPFSGERIFIIIARTREANAVLYTIQRVFLLLVKVKHTFRVWCLSSRKANILLRNFKQTVDSWSAWRKTVRFFDTMVHQLICTRSAAGENEHVLGWVHSRYGAFFSIVAHSHIYKVNTLDDSGGSGLKLWLQKKVIWYNKHDREEWYLQQKYRSSFMNNL